MIIWPFLNTIVWELLFSAWRTAFIFRATHLGISNAAYVFTRLCVCVWFVVCARLKCVFVCALTHSRSFVYRVRLFAHNTLAMRDRDRKHIYVCMCISEMRTTHAHAQRTNTQRTASGNQSKCRAVARIDFTTRHCAPTRQVGNGVFPGNTPRHTMPTRWWGIHSILYNIYIEHLSRALVVVVWARIVYICIYDAVWWYVARFEVACALLYVDVDRMMDATMMVCDDDGQIINTFLAHSSGYGYTHLKGGTIILYRAHSSRAENIYVL